MRLRVLLAVAFAALVILNCNALTTHYVDANGTNPISPYISWLTAATNIQDALNHAASGDTVLVTNGVYQYGGAVNSGSNRIFVLNNTTVQSVNGPAVTIIKGYQVPGTTNGANAVRCVFLAPGASLSGFTLTNGATPNFDFGGGVKCIDTNCLITNCVIIGNASYNGGAGAYYGTLRNCVLIGNSAPNNGWGGGASSSVLVNCLLAHNFAGYISGGAANSTLINCTVVSNVAAAYAGSVSGCTLRNSIVYYNFSYYTNADSNPGFSFSNCCVSFPTNYLGANNFTNPPMFASLSAGDYHLIAASPCVNAGNNSGITSGTDLDGNPRIVGGIVDLGAYEFQSPVHYVKVPMFGATPVSPFTNWITAATNIQDAIDIADANDFIVVSNGIYNNGGRVVFGAMTNRVVIDKPVTVQSVNGPASTTITGLRNANIPPTGIRCVYLTNGAALTGFTLTNGATLNSGDISQEQSGGGAWCSDNGAVLSNCVFAGNAAARFGGGAFQGTAVNCLFTNNSASFGGGAASNVLFDCTLMRNSALYQNFNYGGGAYACTLSNSLIVGNQSVAGGGFGAGAAFSTLLDCTVSNNAAGASGGGIFMGVASSSLISSNRASSGGGAFSNILSNCVLQNNSASSAGGGAYGGTLVNCTVVSNYAGSWGGGIYWGDVTNSIIYYNSSPKSANYQIYQTDSPSFCCTTPLPTNSIGNITNEPLFANLAGSDFHLQPCSPCINAGDNSSAAGNTDLDGNPRIVGGTVDMGAYEFQSPTTVTFFAALQSPTNNPSGITITWQSVNGVNYFIQRSADLSVQPSFSTIQSNIIGLPGTTSYTDTNAAGDGPFFYRVGVQ